MTIVKNVNTAVFVSQMKVSLNLSTFSGIPKGSFCIEMLINIYSETVIKKRRRFILFLNSSALMEDDISEHHEMLTASRHEASCQQGAPPYFRDLRNLNTKNLHDLELIPIVFLTMRSWC